MLSLGSRCFQKRPGVAPAAAEQNLLVPGSASPTFAYHMYTSLRFECIFTCTRNVHVHIYLYPYVHVVHIHVYICLYMDMNLQHTLMLL